MENEIAEIKEIKEIKEMSAKLTRENKKYVIAIANALLFTQSGPEQNKPPENRTA